MPDLTAKRTLVKSPPELWEELSEVERLAKHLGAFGEITITKLEPEHTVAWEGERASGTVSIEPSGWGTKVTLRAELPEPDETEPEPAAATEPEPAAADRGTEAQHVAGPFVPLCVEAEAQPEALGQEPVAQEPEPVAQEPEPVAQEPEPVAQEPEPVAQEPEPVAQEPAPEPEAAPAAQTSEEAPRRGFWGWLFRRRTESAPSGPESEPVAAEPQPEPAAVDVRPEPQPVADEPEPVDSEPVVSEPEPVESEPVVDEPEPGAAAPEPEPVADEPEPTALDAQPEPTADALEPEPVPLDTQPEALGAAAPLDPERARVILDEALDTLGAAHHRPFSRG